jgi:hypothetical protein
MSIGIICIALAALLATKEIIVSIGFESAERIGRILTIPIIGLLITFALLVTLDVTNIVA